MHSSKVIRSRPSMRPSRESLVAIPLAMLAAAVTLDLMGLVAGGAGPLMAGVAYWMLALGLAAALIVVPFALLGRIQRKARPRADRLQTAGHALVAGLFIASWLLRRDSGQQATALALALSFGGAAIALGNAWLGGELVTQPGAPDGAPLNVPNPLVPSHQQAVEPR